MAIQVEFNRLWANLPQYGDAQRVPPRPGEAEYKVFPQIPGLKIPTEWETCCIQLSHTMNQCGLNIDYGNKTRVLKDSSGNEYMLDVKEMRGYLDQKYGPAQRISRVDANGNVIPRFAVQAHLMERKGIIAFGGRHIDLWNGGSIHGERYIESALWEAESTKSDGIFFWEVEDR